MAGDDQGGALGTTRSLATKAASGCSPVRARDRRQRWTRVDDAGGLPRPGARGFARPRGMGDAGRERGAQCQQDEASDASDPLTGAAPHQPPRNRGLSVAPLAAPPRDASAARTRGAFDVELGPTVRTLLDDPVARHVGHLHSGDRAAT